MHTHKNAKYEDEDINGWGKDADDTASFRELSEVSGDPTVVALPTAFSVYVILSMWDFMMTRTQRHHVCWLNT